MNAREMHYDFKQKLNIIDSQQYRNLKVPEIDWKLNEAQEYYVKIIAIPRFKNTLGFEVGQRTIDDIYPIVVDQKIGEGIVPTVFDTDSYIATLPTGYWEYIGSKVYATKGDCTLKKLNTREVQHDDLSESSVFDKSSFDWRIANIRYNKNGLRIFTNGDFIPNKICYEYLERPRYIHNAQDWLGGTYTKLDGTVLTETQSCILPEQTHREIVDLAVLITAGDLNLPNYQMKQNKVSLTNNP
jgi:hypothetical protein